MAAMKPESRLIGLRVSPVEHRNVGANAAARGETVSGALRRLLADGGYLAPAPPALPERSTDDVH